MKSWVCSSVCFYSSSAFSLISFSSALKCLKIPFMAQVICPPAGLGSRGRFAELLSLLISVWRHRLSRVCHSLLRLCSCCASSVVSSLSCCRNSLSHSLTGLCCAQSLSHAQLCVTMKTAARQAPVHKIIPSKKAGVGCHFCPGWSSWLRHGARVSCVARQVLFHCATWEALKHSLPSHWVACFLRC